MTDNTASSESVTNVFLDQPAVKDLEQMRKPSSPKEVFDRRLEIISTILMAVVAVATAWSGYQSTRWGGEQADQYVQASAARVRSASHSTEAGQHTLYDAVMFNNWLNAYSNKEPDLAAKYERRFRPEFQAAFDAWLATDPFILSASSSSSMLAVFQTTI